MSSESIIIDLRDESKKNSSQVSTADFEADRKDTVFNSRVIIADELVQFMEKNDTEVM